MKKTNKFEHVCFLEVAEDDRVSVEKNFPGAKIISKPLSEKELIKEAADAEILSPFIYTKISAKAIKSLKKLRLIATRSVGYNHIDLEMANKKNVSVCNVPDYGAHVIAEFVFALLLSGLRHVAEGDDLVEEKYKFSFQGFKGLALKNKTIGIIGTGKIGAKVAHIASSGFLMNVLAYDPCPNKKLAKENNFQYADLENLLKSSDIISLHCPLLPKTKHLINTKNIALMKDGVVIVNTSRGGVIDTKALVKALKKGKIANAFLDVLEHENNLKKSKELIDLPNVITTPHIAFYADDSMESMYQTTFKAIKAYLNKKELPNKVSGI